MIKCSICSYRYTAASNSCALYGLLLRVQFGCLLQQLLLWAQIGLAHACARSFSSSCEQLELAVAECVQGCARTRKGESCKTWATPLRTTIRRMPEKMREQFCEIGSAFGSRFGTSFGFSFSVLAPVLSIRIVAPKNGAQNCSQNWPQNRAQ